MSRPAPGFLDKACSFCGSPPYDCPNIGAHCAQVSQSSEEVPVVAAVLRREGRVLVCRRPTHKRHGGLWEFPGGKLLPSETLGEAARRELAEELEVELTALMAYLGSHADPGSPFVIHFVEVAASGEPSSLEHDEVSWVAPEDLARFALAPGDRAFARALRAGGSGLRDG